jgi:hypothetical protein
MYSKKFTLSLAVLCLGTSLPVSTWAMDDPQSQRGIPLKIDASSRNESEDFRYCKRNLENLLTVAMDLKVPETKKRMNAFKAIERLRTSNEDPGTYAQRKDRPYKGRIISAQLTQERLDRMNKADISRAIIEISNVLNEDTYSRLGFDSLLKEENINTSLLSKVNYFEARVLLRQMAYYYMEYFGLEGSADQPVRAIGHLLKSEMPYELRPKLAIGRWNPTFSIFETQDFPYWWTLGTGKPEFNWSSEPSMKGSDFIIQTDLGDLSEYSGQHLTVSLDMMCSEFTPRACAHFSLPSTPSISLDAPHQFSKLYYQEDKIAELYNKEIQLTYFGSDKEVEAVGVKTEIQTLKRELENGKSNWITMPVSLTLVPSSQSVVFTMDISSFAAFKIRNLKMTIDGQEIK